MIWKFITRFREQLLLSILMSNLFLITLLGSVVSPVHVMFHIGAAALGWFVLLRGHVDHGATHLCGLGT